MEEVRVGGDGADGGWSVRLREAKLLRREVELPASVQNDI